MAENIYDDIDLEQDIGEGKGGAQRDRLVIKGKSGENRSFPITNGLAKKLKPITEQNKPRLLTEADPDHTRRL